MTKRILLAIGAVVGILIIFEIIGLLRLRHSIAVNRQYWQSRANTSGELTYVALGDSAAQGVGAARPQDGYVGLIAAKLEAATGKRVRVVNLSVSGAKIQDVVQKQLGQVAAYKPGIVTIEIGANDIVGFNAQRFTKDFNQLTAELPAGTYVSNMAYFGGIRYSAEPKVRQASEIVARAVAKHPALRFVDLHHSTEAGQSLRNYSYDMFHPSNRGYRLWFQAFWDAIEPNLRQF